MVLKLWCKGKNFYDKGQGINAEPLTDGTYLLTQTFKEKQNEQERLKGSFQVLDGNILMLVHPASGDNIFYKVMEDNSIIFIDSFGNEPKKVVRKNYILKKRKG